MSDNSYASFTFWLLRPYFDLLPNVEGPLMTKAPLMSYESLATGTQQPVLQRVLSGSFRAHLISESGLSKYAVDDPREVSPAHRTDAWQQLCEKTEAFDSLSFLEKARTARLWIDLAFHALAVRKIPLYGQEDLRVSDETRLLTALRGVANFMLLQGEWDRYSPREFDLILTFETKPTRLRFEVANALLVYNAKVTKDVSRVRECREIMLSCLCDSSARAQDFACRLDWSKFYRSASFLPQLEGNRAQVVSEMNLAEDIARSLIDEAKTAGERVAARENLHPVVESRMREALWLGDLDLALERIEELASHIDPWDAKAHLEFGEVLWRLGGFEAAAREFVTAAQLGPPGTAIAWYMAGECLEKIQEWEQACRAYLYSLRLDPEGITSTRRLIAVAKRIGETPLLKWARDNAARLAISSMANEKSSENSGIGSKGLVGRGF